MSDSLMTAGLVSTWVSTVDARGRAHLETRWVEAHALPVAAPATPEPATAPLAAHAGHAA